MRFGGHESFPLREGWLSNGLSLIKQDPGLFRDKFACDRLGVGRNMAKSIQHWLSITGLIEKKAQSQGHSITGIGKLILKKDPYFIKHGTWWALHLNVVGQKNDAIAWSWFFNRFLADRFDRSKCGSELIRTLKLTGEKAPTAKTLNREISCLLSSYSIPVPPEEDADPEDGKDCPFQSLGLLVHLRETDTYQMNRKHKDIPSALVGYAFATSSKEVEYELHTLSLAQAYADGPGKALALDLETFEEIVQQAEKDLGSDYFHIELSGGEQTIRYQAQPSIEWLKLYYKGS